MDLFRKLLLCVFFLWQISCVLLQASPRVDMNFTELVKFDGYKSEIHYVTTADGYVLSMFRVRAKDTCISGGTEGNAPLLFAHGLYLSGDDCVTPGPGAAHCYLYAEACHDTWVYNARGSRYSRIHTTFNPNTDTQYWNFAFDEMALYDLPVIIDYILDQTGRKQISYISHSQGAAILMLLCSKKPEYNNKIRVGFGLSPVAYMSHSRFIVVEIEKVLSHFLLWMDKEKKHFELFGHGDFSQRMSRFFCALSKLSYSFCSALIFSFIGYNKFHITPEVLPVVFGHLPAGTSAKNFLRWGQVARNGFAEYDYTLEEDNLKKYGVTKPPLFNLSKVTMEWILLGSTNDYIADLRDVEAIKLKLPNARKCVLSDHSVGHLDFVYGTTVAKYIVPLILKFIDKHEFVCL